MNLQTALLDVHQMAEADRLTVAAGGNINELMEHAGWAVKSEIEQRWSSCPVVVLCGPGNNGGDGFVAARFLNEYGFTVRVAGEAGHSGDAAVMSQRWTGARAALTPEALDGARLVVDGLFGAGLSRPLQGACAQVVESEAHDGP